MLADVGRADNYLEVSLDSRSTWNPLSAPWLDAYSIAYTVASLLNQLFGSESGILVAQVLQELGLAESVRIE